MEYIIKSNSYRLLKKEIVSMALKEIEKQQLSGQTQRETIDNIVKKMIEEVSEYVNQND